MLFCIPDVLEERKEHGWDIPRRPEAIHLYGVDCMSTADCLSYFSDYGPTFVEWIDDSSCNVLFEDDYTAKRALVGRGNPLPPDNTAPDTAGANHIPRALVDLTSLLLGNLVTSIVCISEHYLRKSSRFKAAGQSKSSVPCYHAHVM